MRPCKHPTPEAPVCPACVKNRAKVLRWAKRNKRKRRALWRAYYHKHKAACTQRNRLKDYIARGACEVDPLLTIARVWEADDGTCHLCRQECGHPWDPDVDPKMRASMDHLIPLSVEGGPGHVLENVRLAHWLCNVRRGTNPDLKPERARPVEDDGVPF